MKPVQLPAGEVADLMRARESAEAAAQAAPAPEPSPGPAPEFVEARPVPDVDPDQLRPIIGLLGLALRKLGAEPLTDEEAEMWCASAAPVAQKYGGTLPLFEEGIFLCTTAVLFGPRIRQIRDRRTEPQAPPAAA